MPNRSNPRLFIIGTWLLGYLLPLFFLTLYKASYVPLPERWSLLSIGLLLGTVTSCLLLLLLLFWERQLYQPVSPSLLTSHNFQNEPGDVSEGLLHEIEQQKTRHEQLLHDKEDLTHQCEQLTQKLALQQERYNDQLRAKDSQLEEWKQTATDQQNLLEKKQKQITSLENTARDLKYELKTLIDLTDRIHAIKEEEETFAEPLPQLEPAPPPPRLSTPSSSPQPLDALHQLKRYIDIAQKLTGARHLSGHSPRFQDMSVEGYALDLRRLCDSLRSETKSMILLYSQRENKLLFVNNQVKELLGWTPEKFVQDFSHLIVEGKEEWNLATRKLSPASPNEVTIALKSRTGDSRRLRCHLGIIPTGIFKTHIVGVIPLETHTL